MYEKGLKTRDFRGVADFGQGTIRSKNAILTDMKKWRRVELTGWILAGRVDRMVKTGNNRLKNICNYRKDDD